MTDMVKNAADPKQVKHAGQSEKLERDSELGELKALLDHPEFRRFVWRLMAVCGFGENPSRARGDETHQNIGKADIARWMISEMGHAGAVDAWLLMQKEAWDTKRSKSVVAEAIRTASSTEPQSQD